MRIDTAIAKLPCGPTATFVILITPLLDPLRALRGNFWLPFLLLCGLAYCYRRCSRDLWLTLLLAAGIGLLAFGFSMHTFSDAQGAKGNLGNQIALTQLANLCWLTFLLPLGGAILYGITTRPRLPTKAGRATAPTHAAMPAVVPRGQAVAEPSPAAPYILVVGLLCLVPVGLIGTTLIASSTDRLFKSGMTLGWIMGAIVSLVGLGVLALVGSIVFLGVTWSLGHITKETKQPEPSNSTDTKPAEMSAITDATPAMPENTDTH